MCLGAHLIPADFIQELARVRFSSWEERLAIRTNKSRQPRRRRWSPKEVAEIFFLTLSGSLDAPPEQGNHSWGKHPEPFIDDGDDHRSSRVPSSLTWARQTRDMDFEGQSGRGIERPPKMVIRMSGESTLRSGTVDGTCWSWESRTQFLKILHLQADTIPARTFLNPHLDSLTPDSQNLCHQNADSGNRAGFPNFIASIQPPFQIPTVSRKLHRSSRLAEAALN